MSEGRTWGLLAEFTTPGELAAATRRARASGYTRLDAHMPFAADEVLEALGGRTRLGWAVLAAGLLGAASGYLLQWWTLAVYYPLDVGGRPLNSWPLFVPITFESMILCAALTAALGMLARNGLPRPHHPLFGVPGFERATQDRFFLAIEAGDPRFDPAATRRFLERLGARRVSDVPA